MTLAVRRRALCLSELTVVWRARWEQHGIHFAVIKSA
jgi:hypothetical protein